MFSTLSESKFICLTTKYGVNYLKKQKIDYSKRGVEDRKKKLLDVFLDSGYEGILDLGCGAANFSSLLSKKGSFVVGLDFSWDLCKLTKKHGFEVVRGDAMSLPFRNGAFDVVWASEIVEHLPSLNLFDELERVGGKWILATVPNPKSSNYRADPTHILKFSIPSLKTFLSGRKNWCFVVRGIGVEWPSAPFGIKVPRVVRILSFYFMLYLPWISPTLGIIGVKTLPEHKVCP